MKTKIITAIIIAIFLSCFSLFGEPVEENISYSSEMSLIELSQEISIPVKMLLHYFNLDSGTNLNLSLEELEVNQDMISTAITDFKKQKWSFSWSIVLIGMLVIFSSLLLTGLLVQLLSKTVMHLDKDKKVLGNSNNANKTIKSRDTSYDAVIAAITALHCHLQEAEESDKMILAWKREPVSVWKTSAKFYMPNKIIAERKGRNGN